MSAIASKSAIVVAGVSKLLRLGRSESGQTSWSFADAPAASPAAALAAAPSAAAPPASAPTTSSSAQRANMRFEHDAPYGQCVGTLRWSESDRFPALAPWPLRKGEVPPSLTNWRDYLEMRMPADGTGTIRVEPPMLDGLSYPLTLVYALQRLRLRPPTPGPLSILIVGASSKAEERLLRETTYWLELSHFLGGAALELVFLGPEIAVAHHGRTTRHGPHCTARCFHGTLGELLRAEPHRSAEDTIVAGFNTGMGNTSAGMAKGGFALMQSWLPDLVDLLNQGLVAVFTAANDYSDLRGELAIFVQLLQAELILPPAQSPFKAATVVRESDADKCEWSCSSSYVYAICGRVDGAPPLPATSSLTSEPMQALLAKMKRAAKHLARTQTVSQVP